jgi:GNAT superfamily N-acetyltransferase
MAYRDTTHNAVRKPVENLLYALNKIETGIYHVSQATERSGEGAKRQLWTIRQSASSGAVKTIATFTLMEQPGASSLVHSLDFKVDEAYRGKGVGKAIEKFKCDLAYAMGASCMLATCRSDNHPEIALLTGTGWVPRYSYSSRKTGREVLMFTKDVKGPEAA